MIVIGISFAGIVIAFFTSILFGIIVEEHFKKVDKKD